MKSYDNYLLIICCFVDFNQVFPVLCLSTELLKTKLLSKAFGFSSVLPTYMHHLSEESYVIWDPKARAGMQSSCWKFSWTWAWSLWEDETKISINALLTAYRIPFTWANMIFVNWRFKMRDCKRKLKCSGFSKTAVLIFKLHDDNGFC